ncbi:hypothetical protein ACF0H5_004006 [Mactra antiquata]
MTLLIQSKVNCYYIIVVLFLQSTLSTATVCDDIKAKQGTQDAKPLPNIPDAFHVTLRMNDAVERKSSTYQLYYDYYGNRAVTILTDNGSEEKVIFNYNTDELFFIKDYDCTAGQLSTSNLATMFGYTKSNGRLHINDSSTALVFGKRYDEVYIGNTTLDGVLVNHWKGCPPSTAQNTANITMDYYFSYNTTTSSSIQSEPIKAVQIESFYDGSVYKQQLSVVYLYSNFVPDVDDVPDSIFQTPTNVYCTGRKQGKPLPKLPTAFYYKTETIYPDLSAINFESVWYDESFKYFRRDHHPIVQTYPTYSKNPLSEIHDYNTGVRYFIDQSLGNCTTVPLSEYSIDTGLNMTAYKYNESYVLELKTPLQFFRLNYNYTYIGQMTTRDVLCDVYQTLTNNLTVQNFVTNKKVIITVYFLAQDWTEIFDQSIDPSIGTPVKMELYVPDEGFTLTYNFIEFEAVSPGLNSYDVSQCFQNANKLSFQLKLPGALNPKDESSAKEWAHLMLSETMHVSTLRISNVHINRDDANLFISATLLDQTTYQAQFTKIQGKTMEYTDDATLLNSTGSDDCASFCINSPGFICNSFDYCTNDKTCRISSKHVSDGSLLQNTPTCDHYSRNVDGFPKQKSILDAYQSLRKSVYNGSFIIKNVGQRIYTAVDVVITFGWMNPTIDRSSIFTAPSAYSYTVETSIPAQQQTFTTKLWYDDGFQLLRTDIHYDKIVAPYYTTRPLSIVEDFKSGVKYIIDNSYRNCTVTNIDSNDIGVLAPSNVTPDATYFITLRDPLNMFRIDDNYFFVGQETIRGLTCNVFESLRTDFPNKNGTTNAIFRYAFLANSWREISDGYLGGSVGQPIRLEITVINTAQYMVFHFFDFDSDHPDHSLFDVHLCFDSDQTKQLQITFPGHYTEFLNTTSKMFIIEAIFIMSNRSQASLIRFQRTKLDHDDKNVYLTTSLIAQPERLRYFTYIRNGYVPARVDQVVSGSHSVTQCASTCFSNNKFQCNSFYYCSLSSQCLMSNNNVLLSPNGAPHRSISGCVSYSRTSDESKQEPNITVAYRNLANSVFAGQLHLMIPVPETAKNAIIKATYIKDVSLSNEKHDPQGKYLTEYVQLKGMVSLTTSVVPYSTVESDEKCAQTCSKTSACRMFEYCPSTKQCIAFNERQYGPQSNDTTTNCNIYRSPYEKDFKAVNAGTYKIVSTVAMHSITISDCAKYCIRQQNDFCKGFYYCRNTQTCYLPGRYGNVVPSTSSTDIFCDQYNRTHFPLPYWTKSPTTVTKGSSTISTITSTSSTTSTTTTSKSTISLSSSSVGMSSSTNTPCSELQHQTGDSSNSHTGMIAGIATGTFLLGLLLGAVGFYIFKRLRDIDKDDLRTNFIGHEDM